MSFSSAKRDPEAHPLRIPEPLRGRISRGFAIDEIASSISLQWMAGAIILGFFVTFSSWMYSQATTVNAVENGTYLCWPFFQKCSGIIFLSSLPDGYSQTIVFMTLFGALVLCVFMMYAREWEAVHIIILFLFIAKLYFMAINYNFKGNYDYYHNAFCVIYILARYKLFFLRFTLVLFYFLSTASKIYPSWIIGEYFTSLKTGLPIFPFGSEMVMTNIVMLMEMVFAWCLFSSNIIRQRIVLIFFIIFHLYSGILVGYRYPATVLPALIILFGPWYHPEPPPVGRSTVIGWSFAGFLVAAQLVPHFIPGDEKLTLEGNHIGLYMFEANHQCFGTIARNGSTLLRINSSNARNRCDPYDIWFMAKNRFCSSGGNPVQMKLSHSVNGRPFREIVNEQDICNLEYWPLSHNTWIKDTLDAPIVGRPVQNTYR